MTTVILFAKVSPSHRHYYAYDVVWDDELVVANSRDPEHDLARALLARGLKGMAAVIDGKTGHPRSRVNIEKAAKRCIGSDLERYKWKAPVIADSGLPATETKDGCRWIPNNRLFLKSFTVGIAPPQKFPQKERYHRAPPSGVAR